VLDPPVPAGLLCVLLIVVAPAATACTLFAVLVPFTRSARSLRSLSRASFCARSLSAARAEETDVMGTVKRVEETPKGERDEPSE
jgi:hypothetical protein